MQPPDTMPPRRSQDFDAAYEGTPPWDIGRPQPAFQQLADAGRLHGKVLDAGCGTGEHALMAAGLGLDATGIDVAAAAIAIARRKARERDLRARFVVGDALHLEDLDAQFDTVLDCGLFHVFDDDQRARYVESLGSVIHSGGSYHMLCFSDRQPGDWGPRRVTVGEIEASFSTGWRIAAIDATTLTVNLDPDRVLAWQVAISRL